MNRERVGRIMDRIVFASFVGIVAAYCYLVITIIRSMP